MIVTITENFALDPQYLDSVILNRLVQNIRDKYENSCTQEYGYIRKLKKVLGHSNKITNAQSAIVFTVTFQVEAMKFVVGDVVKGVCTVASSGRGVLIEVSPEVHVFVMDTKIKESLGEDIEFDRDQCSFVKDDETILSDGDTVLVTISGTEYNPGSEYESARIKYVGKNIRLQHQ